MTPHKTIPKVTKLARAALSSDGDILTIISGDDATNFSTATGKVLSCIQAPGSFIAYSGAGTQFLVVDSTKATLCDAASGEIVRHFAAFQGHCYGRMPVAFAPRASAHSGEVG